MDLIGLIEIDRNRIGSPFLVYKPDAKWNCRRPNAVGALDTAYLTYPTPRDESKFKKCMLFSHLPSHQPLSVKTAVSFFYFEKLESMS